MNRALGVSVAALFVFVLTDCGGVRTYPGVASGSAQQSPSPPPSVTGGYKAYASQNWLYSLEYPATWYDLPNYGAPDTDKYFSNENLASPMQLDANGIWLSVFVDPKPTRQCSTGAGPSPSAAYMLQASVDGTPTMAYLSQRGVEGPYLMHADWCYHFSFITTSAQDRDLHMTGGWP